MLNVSTDLGPSVVLVPLPSPRVTLRPLGTIDLTRTFFEIALDGVVVPATNLLGTQGGGAELIGRALQLATIIASAEAVGAAEYLLDLVVAYTKTRVQFGRTLGSFQAVKHHLANQVVALEGARAAARYSALALNDQRPDAVEAVHVAGSYVRDACSAIASQSLQLLGGIGFSWEHDLHLFLRRAKTDQALYGEPSWHRDQLFTLLEKAAAR
jgi:alkylation response protein AidB-like acyl-CoA dehydrogenase